MILENQSKVFLQTVEVLHEAMNIEAKASLGFENTFVLVLYLYPRGIDEKTAITKLRAFLFYFFYQLATQELLLC